MMSNFTRCALVVLFCGEVWSCSAPVAEEKIKVKVDKVVVGGYQANCWLVWDPASGEGMVIDPGAEAGKIQNLIRRNQVLVTAVALTHEHGDHAGAASAVMRDTAAVLWRSPDRLDAWGAGAAEEDFPDRVRALRDGDTLQVGALSFLVIAAPGHSPGSICLYGEGLLFTGDLLFKGSMGRYDLAGGDFGVIQESLKKIIALVPDDTQVLPGHGPATTIAAERQSNPYLPTGPGMK